MKFSTITKLCESSQLLTEKQILFNQGKKYGQIVFLAGGGGSGKGFASSNFMEVEKFKVRDVDHYKELFIKIDKITNKYPEVRNLNLRHPGDVAKLHKFIKSNKIREKTLDALLSDLNRDRLPNVMFDITAKNIYEIEEYIQPLLNAGYQPRDIHIAWVLTNYTVAVTQNRARSRVVPDDILLQAHQGTAITMDTILGGRIPKGIDGSIVVILGDREHTVVYTDAKGDPIISKKGDVTIKDFTYFNVKDPEKGIKKDVIKKEVHKWIIEKIPKTKKTAFIFDKK